MRKRARERERKTIKLCDMKQSTSRRDQFKWFDETWHQIARKLVLKRSCKRQKAEYGHRITYYTCLLFQRPDSYGLCLTFQKCVCVSRQLYHKCLCFSGYFSSTMWPCAWPTEITVIYCSCISNASIGHPCHSVFLLCVSRMCCVECLL